MVVIVTFHRESKVVWLGIAESFVYGLGGQTIS